MCGFLLLQLFQILSSFLLCQQIECESNIITVKSASINMEMEIENGNQVNLENTLTRKKLHLENDEATSESSLTLTPKKDFLPVFITLTDEGSNFEEMDFAELNECFTEIKKAVSPLKSMKVARRGDIVINVTTEEQRQILLSLDCLRGRKIRAFSPVNSIKNKGVIYKVPHKFSDEEILKNTNYQNIESVKRINVSKNGMLQPCSILKSETSQ